MSRFFAMEERELENINKLHNDLEKIKAEATQKEIKDVSAIIRSEIENMGTLFEIKDGVAHIPIIGELSEKPSFSATLFGADQTTYGSIIDNINTAVNDDDVEKIIFEIDSPGGTVAGVDQTAMAIRAIKKPTLGRVHNMAASAAYYLAAQTDKIISISPTAEIGSIGVAAEIIDSSERDNKNGVRVHTIVSNNSEDKRPDITTNEGRDKIKSRLNEMYSVFVRRVAEGRGISEDKVLKDFGKGGVLIASKALNVGMIDAIEDGDVYKTENKTDTNIPAKGGKKNKREVKLMTKAELKTDDPALYNDIFQAGVKTEKDRVSAHLIMGKKADAMDFAIKCIEDDKNLSDQTVVAEYMSAGMNKSDLDKRENDDPGETEINPNAKTDEDADFAAALNESLNLEAN
jgi:signal peptide peptidase SppA